MMYSEVRVSFFDEMLLSFLALQHFLGECCDFVPLAFFSQHIVTTSRRYVPDFAFQHSALVHPVITFEECVLDVIHCILAVNAQRVLDLAHPVEVLKEEPCPVSSCVR